MAAMATWEHLRCGVCGDYALVPFACWDCDGAQKLHHGRCCPAKRRPTAASPEAGSSGPSHQRRAELDVRQTLLRPDATLLEAAVLYRDLWARARIIDLELDHAYYRHGLEGVDSVLASCGTGENIRARLDAEVGYTITEEGDLVREVVTRKPRVEGGEK